MGIKDWFGGDKKKAAYREKVKEAVADGKLSSTDIQQLQELREQLDVTDAGDDRTSIRREIYDEAFDAKKSKGELNATGLHDLAKIKRSLGSLIVLWHIERARELRLPFVYLGYWIAGSAKMAYKARFRPLEQLTADGWEVMPDAPAGATAACKAREEVGAA